MKSVVCYLMVLYLSLTTGVPSPESQPQSQQPTESLESVKSSQSQMITGQKDVLSGSSQSIVNSVLPSRETETEYPVASNLEQVSSAATSRGQSEQISEVGLNSS